MSSSCRLTFLYPHLLRTARAISSPAGPRRWVATTTRSKSSFAPRHGKAVEPTWNKEQGGPRPGEDLGQGEKDVETASGVKSSGAVDVAAAAAAAAAVMTAKSSKTNDAPAAAAARLSKTVDAPTAAAATTTTTSTRSSKTVDAQAAPSPPKETAVATTSSPKPDAPKRAEKQVNPVVNNEDHQHHPPPPTPSLDAVLHMPSPENVQHPHLSPPPYAHHFDSYSMVKQLEQGGYTKDQAVTSMKAIRTLLASNLDVAQKSLVSKSDVENETYLFHAACSELGTEIKNNRRLQEEQMRQQRTHLQHEIDILTQTLNQEVLTLNDSVRGLFNDRNMTVREEQKAVESAIQQINYKMSILLSSDSKSEIEGVRWVLIRRSVVGLLFLAIITLSMIRYTTYLAQQRKKEAEKRRRERERLKRDGGRTDNSAPADAAVILSAS